MERKPSLFWVLSIFLALSILLVVILGGGEIPNEVVVGSQAFCNIEAVCTECNALTLHYACGEMFYFLSSKKTSNQ